MPELRQATLADYTDQAPTLDQVMARLQAALSRLEPVTPDPPREAKPWRPADEPRPLSERVAETERDLLRWLQAGQIGEVRRPISVDVVLHALLVIRDLWAEVQALTTETDQAGSAGPA